LILECIIPLAIIIFDFFTLFNFDPSERQFIFGIMLDGSNRNLTLYEIPKFCLYVPYLQIFMTFLFLYKFKEKFDDGFKIMWLKWILYFCMIIAFFFTIVLEQLPSDVAIHVLILLSYQFVVGAEHINVCKLQPIESYHGEERHIKTKCLYKLCKYKLTISILFLIFFLICSGSLMSVALLSEFWAYHNLFFILYCLYSITLSLYWGLKFYFTICFKVQKLEELENEIDEKIKNIQINSEQFGSLYFLNTIQKIEKFMKKESEWQTSWFIVIISWAFMSLIFSFTRKAFPNSKKNYFIYQVHGQAIGHLLIWIWYIWLVTRIEKKFQKRGNIFLKSS
jgi:hypothetical protein